MPNYAFRCLACKHTFEEFFWYSEKLPEKCLECGAIEPDFGQDFTKNYGSCGWVYGEEHATTFGQQSQYNIRRTGKERLEKMAEAEAAKRTFKGKLPAGAKLPDTKYERPWWRDSDEVLKVEKLPDVQRYIHEGK